MMKTNSMNMNIGMKDNKSLKYNSKNVFTNQTQMINQDYIKQFVENEDEYNKFYTEEVQTIKLFYLYINENNEIYNVKLENEQLENSYLTKERLLYLIKNNQFNLIKKHKLVSLLKYNIDLEHTELKNFLIQNEPTELTEPTENEPNHNYLTSLKMIDSIYFKDTIQILQDLNSIIFIYTNNIQSTHNTTKKINIKPKTSKSKTRHNR